MVLRQLLGASSREPWRVFPYQGFELHKTINDRVVYERSRRESWRSTDDLATFDTYLTGQGARPQWHLGHGAGTPTHPPGNALSGLVHALPLRRTPLEIWNHRLPAL